MKDDKEHLTRKQKIFIDEYLICFNASEAARRAGYSKRSAHHIGWENLKHPLIAEVIQQRLTDVHMSADEALKLTADIARADIGNLIDDNGLLDLRTARAKGMTKLIKKIKQKNSDEIEIELYNAQDAIRDVLKIHGKFVERHDVTTKDGTINVIIQGLDD